MEIQVAGTFSVAIYRSKEIYIVFVHVHNILFKTFECKKTAFCVKSHQRHAIDLFHTATIYHKNKTFCTPSLTVKNL